MQVFFSKFVRRANHPHHPIVLGWLSITLLLSLMIFAFTSCVESSNNPLDTGTTSTGVGMRYAKLRSQANILFDEQYFKTEFKDWTERDLESEFGPICLIGSFNLEQAKQRFKVSESELQDFLFSLEQQYSLLVNMVDRYNVGLLQSTTQYQHLDSLIDSQLHQLDSTNASIK